MILGTKELVQIRKSALERSSDPDNMDSDLFKAYHDLADAAERLIAREERSSLK